MTPRRRELLEIAAALAIELGRAPSAGDVAALMRQRHGLHLKTIYDAIGRARDAGLLTPYRADRRLHERTPIRLTAAARLELGLPLLTYLAWPMPVPDARRAAHDYARRIGLELAARVLARVPGAVPVSPYFVRHGAEDRARLDAAAVTLAAAVDAVIAWRDGMLLGRADAAAAVRGGAHAVVMREEDLETEDPWSAARLARP